MNPNKWFTQISGLALLILVLAACNASQTPLPTATSIDPVATSVLLSQTPSKVSTPDSIAEADTPTYKIVTDSPYARMKKINYRLDAYAPSEQGSWPVVIVVHGASETRSNYAPLAEAIASLGAVVYNIDTTFDPPFSVAIESIACAVRFARTTAAEYGGDPDWIILVGTSGGAAAGSVVALAGDDFQGDCVETNGSAQPNGFVGFEGPYDYATTVYNLIDHVSLKDENPELWKAINPYSHIGRNPGLQVRLVYGEDNDIAWWDVKPEVSIEFHQALAAAGYDAELIVVEGANHNDISSPSSEAFAVMIHQVMELMHSPLE